MSQTHKPRSGSEAARRAGWRGILIQVPPEVYDALDRAARGSGRSLKGFATRAVCEAGGIPPPDLPGDRPRKKPVNPLD